MNSNGFPEGSVSGLCFLRAVNALERTLHRRVKLVVRRNHIAGFEHVGASVHVAHVTARFFDKQQTGSDIP